ncbi:MAG: heavy metal-associated domain-containing protein [Vicingaceae bacterium]|nr:heavy metal-associated domain-containing protein [Vicingaceae bacterium]
MKTLKTLSIIALIIISTNNIKAQTTKSKETIVIKTSTECNMCKERVEKEMAYTKGIISSSLNVEKAELTVVYKSHKTTPEKIRKTISDLGYDADDVKANKKAHNELPNCCQKGGMSH